MLSKDRTGARRLCLLTLGPNLTGNAHLPHAALDCFVVDAQPLLTQLRRNPPHAVERVGGVDLFDPLLEGDLLWRRRYRLVVQA